MLLDAADRIAPYVHYTPVQTAASINEMVGCHLFVKCENLQKVGAFKIRGATNTLLQLAPEEKANGVATHSSGNHAQAVALAATNQGVKATILMPHNAKQVKKDAVKGYRAEVIECEASHTAREQTLNDLIAKTGSTYIPPFNDYRIIAGQSTVAQELLQQVEEPDAIVAPVGGGGLLSGTALAASYFGNHVEVLAAEPEVADDAYRSFYKGELIPGNYPETVADGLRVSLGDKPFGIIKDHVSDVITVAEDEITSAMRLVWERMKLVIEPSAAVPLAAVWKERHRFADKRIGVMLSGGNVDVTDLPF
jgi:threonine dehydratase